MLFAIMTPWAELQAEEPCVPPAPDPSWYDDSFIHAHLSIGLRDDWLDLFKREVELVKPDTVQFHMTGGLPGQALPVRLARKYGFHYVMVINLATTWRKSYDNDPRFVYERNPDGSQTGRWGRKELCLNSPAVDQVQIPFYAAAARTYHPAQIWIDENVIGINLCYCEYCTALYKKETGHTPPIKRDDPHWVEWVTFHRHTFDNWMKKVADAVHQASPNTIVTFNHAYFVEQPERPPAFIHNLCADLHHVPLMLGVYARYGAAAGVPYDLMPGLSRDRWAGDKPKTLDWVKEDIAIITANGGRWNIGEFPTNAGVVAEKIKVDGTPGLAKGERPVERYIQLAREGMLFARARQPWAHKTTPVPYAAILHSATTQYLKCIPAYQKSSTSLAGKKHDLVMTSDGLLIQNGHRDDALTRVYWPDNKPIPDAVVGAYAGLIENHIPFNIISEDTLNRTLEHYQLLIVPEQFALSDQTIESIKTFVERGGALIATGSTIESGLPSSLLGCAPVGHDKPVIGQLNQGDISLTLVDPYHVKPTTGHVRYSFMQPANWPAIIVNQFGKGRVIYVAGSMFDRYYDQTPYHRGSRGDVRPTRELLASLIDKVVSSRLTHVVAPPWYEVVVNRKGDSTLIDLVDRGREWRYNGHKTIGGASVIQIDIALSAKPSAVRLQPGGEALNWTWTDGRVHVSVPINKIDIQSVVEITGATPAHG